jgi:hypothetical protein
MSIVLDGTTGITTPGLTNTGTETIVNLTTTGNTILGDASTDTLNVGNGGLVKDASGNVGIGETSPTTKLDVKAAQGRIKLTSSTGTNNALFLFNNTGGNAYVGLDSSVGSLTAAYALNLYHEGAYPITFSTNSAERARIDTSGNLLVGTTSSSFGEKLSVQSIASNTNIAYFNYTYTDDRSNTVIKHARATGATAASMILFVNASGSQVGLISSTGSVTTYGTSSDYRLKENIAPMTGALAKVAQLKPCTYTWKDGGEQAEGFIAHELQEVVPHAVVGDKDAVNEDGSIKPQSIDTSFLVATLTAAIQELKTLADTQASTITTLTDRITALETPTGTQA